MKEQLVILILNPSMWLELIRWVFHLDSENEAAYSPWARGRKALPLWAEEAKQGSHSEDRDGEEEEGGKNDPNQLCKWWSVSTSRRSRKGSPWTEAVEFLL